MAIDHASREARPEQSPHLNEAVTAAVETARSLDRHLVLSPDGLLDARDLTLDRGGGPRADGWHGCRTGQAAFFQRDSVAQVVQSITRGIE